MSGIRGQERDERAVFPDGLTMTQAAGELSKLGLEVTPSQVEYVACKLHQVEVGRVQRVVQRTMWCHAVRAADLELLAAALRSVYGELQDAGAALDKAVPAG